MEDCPEVVLILLQHLLRLIQGIVSVAENVDEARVQDSVFIAVILLDAGGEVV